MAIIDKTYIDWKDYKLYRQWWIENHDLMIRERGKAIWLYPFAHIPFEPVTPELLEEHEHDLRVVEGLHDFVLWNTGEAWDEWLVKHCPIQSYRDRMIEVYDENWKGFKGQDWGPRKKRSYRNKKGVKK